MKPTWITFFAFCTGLLATAYGLQCYHCDGEDSFIKDGDCGDTFKKPEDMLETCNSTQTYCRKQKTGANSVWTKVKRNCAEDCEERNTIYVDRVTCCKTDGCNEATSVVVVVALPTLVMVAILQLML